MRESSVISRLSPPRDAIDFTGTRSTRSRLAVAALLVSVAAMGAACVADDPDPERTADSMEWLFVQTAAVASVPSDATLVVPVEREIFGFTDRPNREHAYLTADEFVSLWDEGVEDGFADVAPNAVITWTADGELTEAEVALLDASLSDDGMSITYSVSIEAGSLPDGDIDGVSLFVDASMAVQTMQYQRKLWKDSEASQQPTE